MNVTYTPFPFLTLLVCIPALTALILWLVRPLHRHARVIGLSVSGIEIALAIVAAIIMDWSNPGTWQLYELYQWIPSLQASYAVGVNGIAILMIILAVALVPIVLLAAWNEQEETNLLPSHNLEDNLVQSELKENSDLEGRVDAAAIGVTATYRRQTGFVAWILLLESFMVIIFAARDVLLFYICFEAMLIPVYFLIGIYGGPNRKKVALKFLLYSLAGGLIMLVGVVALYIQGPGGPQGMLISTLASVPNLADNMWIFVAFFIAFAIKAPMWPVHTWLPDTTEQATAGTSTILVGVLDKVGTFGMLVLCVPLFPVASAKAAPVIMVLALLSILIGAFVAIGQTNLMRLIAYTSVSHFGFMVMGIFSGNKIAIAGAMVYMIAHGVATSAMFLLTAMLAKRGGSYEIPRYGGWQRVTPLLAGLWLLSGLASIALPGLSGFVPEYLTIMGSFQSFKQVALLAVVGVIISSLYILIPYQRIFTGPKPDNLQVSDLGLKDKLVISPLVVAMFVLGFFPGIVLEAVNPTATEISTSLNAVSHANSITQTADTQEEGQR